MTRLVEWFFRRRAEPAQLCRRCGAALSVCSSCQGRWRSRACDCGLGQTCPVHTRHWF